MSESIIIHFNESDHAKITNLIESQFGSSQNGMWHYPEDDYLIIITRYEDINSEYEPQEIESVITKLNGKPSASYDFEIRRSRSEEACDVIESFVRTDLQALNFVVDDMFRTISGSEFEVINDFLDCYKYKKMQNPKIASHRSDSGA
ncbi:MAG: hypothetical protein ACSHX6_04065 [Akkermansiaceae bacterium]